MGLKQKTKNNNNYYNNNNNNKLLLLQLLGSRLIFRREGKMAIWWIPCDAEIIEIPLGFLFPLRWLLAKNSFFLFCKMRVNYCAVHQILGELPQKDLCGQLAQVLTAKPMRRLGVRKRDTGTLCVDLSSTSFWACLVDVVSRTWSSGRYYTPPPHPTSSKTSSKLPRHVLST